MAKKELTMAEKHFNYEVRELKLGASFTNNKASQYHTIKYDFKPASVDVTKMATVDVGLNNQVTVTVPHLDGAGVPQTVFKGNQRPYTKECVLIIDHDTGEITLEKLSSNIQVKKTRSEPLNKPRPLTPVISELTNTTQRSTSRTRVATNKRTSGNAGPSSSAAGAGNSSRFNGSSSSQKTPPNMVRSPPRMKTSPPQAAPWSGGNSTLASLPMIGLDLDVGLAGGAGGAGLGGAQPQGAAPAPPAPPAPPAGYEYGGAGGAGAGAAYRAPDRHQYAPATAPAPDRHHASDVGHVSNMTAVKPEPAEPMQEDSSSSSSSDSGSDSDSASDSDNEAPAAQRAPLPHHSHHHHHQQHQQHHAVPAQPAGNPPLPRDVLTDDLCLSESGSDTD